MLQVTGTLDWARAKQSVKHLMDMDGNLRQLEQRAEDVRDSIIAPAEASRPDGLPYELQENHMLRLVEVLTFECKLDHAATTVKYAEEQLQLLCLLSGKLHHEQRPALYLALADTPQHAANRPCLKLLRHWDHKTGLGHAQS